jgi:hypothetical protein
MDKRNVDKTRHSVSGLKVENRSLWGTRIAYERYGKPEYLHGAPSPEDRHAPQRLGDSNNLQGPNYHNDTSGWLRAEGEDATTRPGYVPGYRAPRGEPGTRGGPPLRKGAKGPHG